MIDFRTPKVMSDNRKRINIVMLLDTSSSMQGHREQTISGFNSYLDTLKTDQTTNVFLTLVGFDSMTKTWFYNKPLNNVENLTFPSYNPQGFSTALLDAVGSNLETLSENPENSTLFVVITDGEENASKKFNKTDIERLMKSKQATDKYTFVFLGADQDAWGNASQLGYSLNNTKSFKSSDFRNTFHQLGASTNCFRSNVDKGMYSSTQDFYSAADVKEDVK